MLAISLQNALSEAERLPHSLQNELGRELLERIERARLLWDKLDQPTQSLDDVIG